MQEMRKFNGIFIPKEVWLDERINALDKIILMEIDSLDSSEEGCFASNEYLGNFCQCSPTKISYSINKMIKLGYIEMIKFDGKRRYLKTKIWQTYKNCKPYKNCKADLQNLKGSYNILYINNILLYNILKNKKEKINISKDIFIKRKKKKVSQNITIKIPTLEDIKEYCKTRKNNVNPKKFFNYYNDCEWIDSNGKKIINWKQKVILWEKDDINVSQKTNKPKWIDKEIKSNEATKEEIEELNRMLGE